jgi:hypothetical protein
MGFIPKENHILSSMQGFEHFQCSSFNFFQFHLPLYEQFRDMHVNESIIRLIRALKFSNSGHSLNPILFEALLDLVSSSH